MHKESLLLLLLLLFACTVSHDALGQALWQTNGVPVCSHTAAQSAPTIDGWQDGGGTIAWIDGRGTDADVYFQRLRPNGTTQFPPQEGLPVCTAAGEQLRPIVRADAADGTFIGWTDFRAVRQIYVQYVNAVGLTEFVPNGIPTTTTLIDGGQDYARFVGSALGEVIILNWRLGLAFGCQCNVSCPWYQTAQGQKLTRAGARLWGASGSFYSTWGCTAESELQMRPVGVGNGSEGALVAWDRFCCVNGGDPNNRELYAKAVASNGTGSPADAGLPVCDVPGHQANPQTTTNLSGGAIVCWEDHRTASSDIHAQWIYGTGDNVRWTVDGELIASSSGDLRNPKIAHDGSGGAWIGWENHADASDVDLYVQHVTIFGDTTGTRIPICRAPEDQGGLELVEDGVGGVICAWWDERTGFRDIYAQSITGNGSPRWPENGFPVCTASFDQDDLQITSDGQTGAVVVWRDQRTVGNPDIYAQRLNDTVVGVENVAENSRLLLTMAPNPMIERLSIALALPRAANTRISVFSVLGSSVTRIWNGPLDAGLHEWVWDGTDDKGKVVSSGMYLLAVESGSSRTVRRVAILR